MIAELFADTLEIDCEFDLLPVLRADLETLVRDRYLERFRLLLEGLCLLLQAIELFSDFLHFRRVGTDLYRYSVGGRIDPKKE